MIANSEQRDLSIGLFDSGFGGLTVLSQLRKELPRENFIYLGDTARTPWGSKSRTTIIQYSQECVNFLKTQGVKLIVVACNTASSTALSDLISSCACPVVGMISSASDAAASVTKGKIGIIGTRATIESGAYQKALKSSNADIQIFNQACPLFVPLVEEGIFEGAIVDAVIEQYLSAMRKFNPDTLIMACTHYPLLRKSLERYFELGITIIDCGEASASVVKNVISEHNLNGSSLCQGKVRYYVTEAADRFKEIAQTILDPQDMEVAVVEV